MSTTDMDIMSADYKYTENSNSVLSIEQRDFYEKNGFLLIKNLVSPKSIEEYRQRFVDICNGKDPHTVSIIMKDVSLKNTGAKGEFLINKIQDFIYDDVLFKYCCEKEILRYVEAIIGPDIAATHTMLINKPPKADKEFSLHPLHQDLYYFPFRPAEKIVAAWTAMETINEENGCLYVVPGSHTGDLYRHGYPKGTKNKFYHGVYGLDDLPKIDLFMETGDTVFFHPVLLHGSWPNKSKRFRKAISCHFANSNCNFINVQGTVQEEIAVEITQMFEKRGIHTTYQDLWKSKSRLVQGNSGSFLDIKSNL